MGDIVRQGWLQIQKGTQGAGSVSRQSGRWVLGIGTPIGNLADILLRTSQQERRSFSNLQRFSGRAIGKAIKAIGHQMVSVRRSCPPIGNDWQRFDRSASQLFQNFRSSRMSKL